MVLSFYGCPLPTLLRTVTSSSRGMMTSSFITASSRLQVTCKINILFNKKKIEKITRKKYVITEKTTKN
jgi:hypothetical protein